MANSRCSLNQISFNTLQNLCIVNVFAEHWSESRPSDSNADCCNKQILLFPANDSKGIDPNSARFKLLKDRNDYSRIASAPPRRHWPTAYDITIKNLAKNGFDRFRISSASHIIDCSLSHSAETAQSPCLRANT